MNWLRDAQSAVRGSWRLFLRDTGGFDDFDLSERGFWRSFAAIVPIAPLYLYASTIKTVDELEELTKHAEPDQTSLAMVTIAMLVQWFCWPLVMAIIARFAGLSQNYGRYIISYNWGSILMMLAQLLPVLLFAQGAAVQDVASLLFAIVLAAVLYYRWYIALTALETTGMIAWALVLGDLVLSMGIVKLIT